MYMDNLLDWPYFCNGKSMDELRQTMMLTSLELENTRIKAQEELKMRDDQLHQLKDLLNRAIEERDEANEKCQRILFENHLLQHQLKPQLGQWRSHDSGLSVSTRLLSGPGSGVSSIEDELRRGVDSKSSSDCDESIVSSPNVDANPPPQHQKPPSEEELLLVPIVATKPLPEKGKFLQAVMKAGPLLQTLLLAGPLPEWRHPPPTFDTHQIPPLPLAVSSPPPPPMLTITSLHQDSLLNFATCSNSINNNCGRLNRKRGFSYDYDSPNEAKYQRFLL